jgi:hypothetical protein
MQLHCIRLAVQLLANIKNGKLFLHNSYDMAAEIIGVVKAVMVVTISPIGEPLPFPVTPGAPAESS